MVFLASTAGKSTNIEETCVGIWYMSVENKLDSNVLSVTENSINSLILKDILKISILCYPNSVKVLQFIEQEQYLDTKEAQ